MIKFLKGRAAYSVVDRLGNKTNQQFGHSNQRN